MSDEVQAKPRARKRPVRKTGAPPRPRAKAKDAATGETIASPRTPVSVVPEIPAPPAAPRRGASVVRLGLLSTALAAMIGGLAWLETPDIPPSESFQIVFGAQPPRTAQATPAPAPTPQARAGIEEELRLAALVLQMRESQESLSRLWDDARTLAASVGALASGIESLKADVDAARGEVAAVRSDALQGLARVADRLDEIEVAAAPEPIRLGDPALREIVRLGHPDYADGEPAFAQAHEPMTTAGLPEPEIAAPPEARVTVTFAKPKPRIKSPKPIAGWTVHTVRENLALVEGGGAHYEVRAGEELPGAGVVRSIKKRGERWVVLTNKGVITEPR